MFIDEFRDYCLGKNAVTEEFPFDEKTLVFKVAGKMFALTSVDHFQSINLKADPEKSIDLRETYQGVNPGYHMSKKHWNTISVDSDVPDKLILELIDNSYQLVAKGLTRKLKIEHGLDEF